MPTLRNFIIRDNGGRYETAHPITERQLLNAAKTILKRRYKRSGPALESPDQTRKYLIIHLAEYGHEVFACLFLDNRHRVIAFEEMFQGTINGASVHPREVVKKALDHNAASVILTHNHPSGVAEPSEADRLITRQLTNALSLVDIRVLDHLIVGGTETVSFAERGLL